jgi:hypothetical protein
MRAHENLFDMGEITFDHRLSHGAESSGIESLLHDGEGGGKNGSYSKPRAATSRGPRWIPPKSMRHALFDDLKRRMHAARPSDFAPCMASNVGYPYSLFTTSASSKAAVKSARAQRGGSRRLKLPVLAPITSR